LHLPELFAADPRHGERFPCRAAGVLDYTKNRRPEQELLLEAFPEEIVPRHGRVTDRQDPLRAV